MECTECGGQNPEPFRFCGHCGSELPRAGARPDSQAEWRQLTVVFCDLVGSTRLSGELDAEQLRELVRQYQTVCVEAIEHYGGHIAQYLGDGILAYFGYPQAHEEDAQRAVHAALDIASAVPLLEFEVPLAVRIGMHSGLTVTGEVGAGKRREQLALGETPNIAARLQALAQPNTVVLSAATRALAGAAFQYEDLGPQELKGVARPIDAHKVLGKVLVRSRFQACQGPRAMHLVGRGQELRRLREQFARASQGEEQTVLIEGPAGIGKSRLIQALYDSLASEAYLSLAGQCAEYEGNTVLFPVTGMLRERAGFAAGDSASQKLERLGALLTGLGCERDDTLAYLADLLGVPLDSAHAPATASPGASAEMRRLRTLQAVLQVIRRSALTGPVLLVIEDLHWADPTTFELLRLLVEQPGKARLLTVLTHRPEHRPQFAPETALERICLGGLAPEVVGDLARSVTGGRTMPPEVVAELIDKCDGVPLFVVELTRALVESGALRERDDAYELEVPLSELQIPSSLHASLIARFDRLGHAKEVAQLGAVLGRRFELDLIRAASALEEARLQHALDLLVAAELVDAHAAAFEFRHALIRDTAYASMLTSTRQRYHRLVARVLEDLRPGHRDERPELLAHHWSLGGVCDKAAPLFHRAGERAAALYANDEAISFLRSAIGQVRRILLGDETSEHWLERYCAMQERIGDVSLLVRRHDEARRALRQAIAQVSEGDSLLEARLHRKLGKLYVERQEPTAAARAFDMAEAALGPEPDGPDPDWRHEWVNIQLGRLWMHYWQGQGEPMQALMERVGPFIAHHTTPHQRSDFFNQRVLSNFRHERYAMSPETLAHALAFVEAAEQTGDIAEQASAQFTCGFVMLFKGDLDDAEVMLQRALGAARKSGNKTIEIRILTYMSTLYRRRNEPARVHELGGLALDAAIAAGVVEYVGMIEGNFAWAAYREGDLAQTERHGQAALAQFAKMRIPYPFRWTALLPLLALAHARDRHADVAIYLRDLCADDQQRLPEPLWSALGRARDAVACTAPADVSRQVGIALDMAMELGYLYRA